jgi:uncharacterized protein (DUF305 family)
MLSDAIASGHLIAVGSQDVQESIDTMSMSKTFATAAVILGLSSGAWATEYDNDDDDRSGHVPVAAHEIFLLGPGETVDPAAVRADLEYVTGMVPHHEGALIMSTAYLEDPRGTNPILRELAHAIIFNQRFEIALLEEVRHRVEEEPQTLADLGFARLARRELGIDGLEHHWKFVKRRPPGLLALALAPGLEASERDVKFAREMMLHHQMAIDMARAYNADSDAGNLILQRLNFDIMVDQANEIGLLQQIVDRFPGDPNTVELDESIPGMDMPMHHGEGMDHPTSSGRRPRSARRSPT